MCVQCGSYVGQQMLERWYVTLRDRPACHSACLMSSELDPYIWKWWKMLSYWTCWEGGVSTIDTSCFWTISRDVCDLVLFLRQQKPLRGPPMGTSE